MQQVVKEIGIVKGKASYVKDDDQSRKLIVANTPTPSGLIFHITDGVNVTLNYSSEEDAWIAWRKGLANSIYWLNNEVTRLSLIVEGLNKKEFN